MKATLIASLASVEAVHSGWLDNTAKVVAILAPVLVAGVQALRKQPKKRSHKRKATPAVVATLMAGLVLTGAGCKTASFPESVRALSGDTNSWFFKVTTPFGGLDYGRNVRP